MSEKRAQQMITQGNDLANVQKKKNGVAMRAMVQAGICVVCII